RGCPSIHPFWEAMALYLGLYAFVVFPIFDDCLRTRRLVRNTFLPLFCFVSAVAQANLKGPTPHIGSLAGIAGVLSFTRSYWIYAIGLLIILYPIAWGLEALAVDFWRRVRVFADAIPSIPKIETRLPPLLPVLATAAVIQGVWVGLDHRKAVRTDSFMHN